MEDFRLQRPSDERERLERTKAHAARDANECAMGVRRAQQSMANARREVRPYVVAHEFLSTFRDTYPTVDIANGWEVESRFLENYRQYRSLYLKDAKSARAGHKKHGKRTTTAAQEIAMFDTMPFERTVITQQNIRNAWLTNKHITRIEASTDDHDDDRGYTLYMKVYFEGIVMSEALNPDDYPHIPLFPFMLSFSIAENGDVRWGRNEGHEYHGYADRTIHPHWLSDEPCLGTFGEPFREAIKNGHVDVALSILTGFLCQYTVDDAAGKKAGHWIPGHNSYSPQSYWTEDSFSSTGLLQNSKWCTDGETPYRFIVGDCYELSELKALWEEILIQLNDLEPGRLQPESEDDCDVCGVSPERCECETCEVCHDTTHVDEMCHFGNFVPHPNNRGGVVESACEECYGENFERCPECDTVVTNADFNFDRNMCGSCAEEQEEASDD